MIIHGDSLADSKAEAERLSRESSGELTLLLPHDDPRVIAGQAISSHHCHRHSDGLKVGYLPYIRTDGVCDRRRRSGLRL